MVYPQEEDQTSYVYQSTSLSIRKITEHSYIHTSYLDLGKSGKFPCNGLIVLDGGEAIVLDTPANHTATLELINWLLKSENADIKAVIVNHHHDDCLGGLDVFHQKQIPSYAHNLTIDLAAKKMNPIPKNGFENSLELHAGDQKVITAYYGSAHTIDNVVCYLPGEELLFGGCMVKSLEASKGNVEDADIKEWPLTIGKIAGEYPSLKLVVPGHGKAGGTELLDYTIALFTD
ncbi:MAG: subclass B1 metallo-beta-lactamase [Flavobacteriaceae bacterium]